MRGPSARMVLSGAASDDSDSDERVRRDPPTRDYQIPETEPKETDEKIAMDLRILASDAVLKGTHRARSGATTAYYREPTQISTAGTRSPASSWVSTFA